VARGDRKDDGLDDPEGDPTIDTPANDLNRPRYHTAARPDEGICLPYDPNGAIFWKGRYHLMYIYQEPARPHGGHCWGHLSSPDLLNWRQHSPCVVPEPADPDVGIFSGNAFVNKEGVPMLCWFGVEAGVCIAEAGDDDLIHWKKHPNNPIIPIPREGEPGHGEYIVWDPYLWLEGDTYYCLLGGNRLPNGKDTLSLCRSDDLVNWEHMGPFYEHPDLSWTTGEDEDCSCPDFFSFGEKRALLCISHKVGARIYIGRYENERFYPEQHVRMNWGGAMYFAPESLIDDRGRRIIWAWVTDPRTGPAQKETGSGTMSIPRILTLDENSRLQMEPVPELEQLRRNPLTFENLNLSESPLQLEGVQGAFLELNLEVRLNGAEEVGVTVRRAPDGSEETVVSYDAAKQVLRIDMSRSTLREDVTYGQPPFTSYNIQCVSENPHPYPSVEAPLELASGEPLQLRIFLDGPLLEVFANERQAITQQIYPQRPDSLGIQFFARGGEATIQTLESWEMGSITVDY
jgi:beta-fructofuranosidase